VPLILNPIEAFSSLALFSVLTKTFNETLSL